MGDPCAFIGDDQIERPLPAKPAREPSWRGIMPSRGHADARHGASLALPVPCEACRGRAASARGNGFTVQPDGRPDTSSGIRSGFADGLPSRPSTSPSRPSSRRSRNRPEPSLLSGLPHRLFPLPAVRHVPNFCILRSCSHRAEPDNSCTYLGQLEVHTTAVGRLLAHPFKRIYTSPGLKVAPFV
jgi:hypothetical protein